MSDEHDPHLPPGNDEETSPLPERSESPGGTIGPYKILSLLGEGGMGIVYLAEETGPIRRRVALKIVKLGMDTKQVIARFESERQALAMMNHPNVARVFGAGTTERGRPYFVMEYVAGVPITEYCDRHQLSLADRLRLFIPICHAIQHAHQKGIIHRDLKPGNVLVTLEDEHPVPKVIDFGVAKATEHRLTESTIFTEQGQLIGTPEYMSPEQAEMTALDIDTRTDVYSLGVLLYELLTGTLPFESATLRRAAFIEIQKIIREQDPPRPSTRLSSLGDASKPIARQRRLDAPTLQHELRGDLDWIVMKAMEKDRTHRYATALELANDVVRHLNNEPVVASPPSASYRLRKFVRRNRGPVIAGLAVVSALIVGLVVSASLYVRAERERLRVVAAEGLAQRRLDQANAVTDFLRNMLSSVDPFRPDPKPSDLTVRQALDDAAGRIDSSFAKQPELEAAVRYTLGVTYYSLASYDQAEGQLERTLTIRRALFGKQNPETADALWNLAITVERKQDLARAQSMLRELLAVSRDAPRDLAEYRALSLHELAFIAYQEGRFDESAQLFGESIPARREVSGDRHKELAQDLHALACVQVSRGRYPEADSLFRASLAMKRSILGDEHPDVAECMSDFAACLQAEGELAEAEAMARGGFEMSVRILGHVHPFTIGSLLPLSRVLCAEGRHDEAERLLKEELATQRKLLGNDHSNIFETLYELGNVTQKKGNLGDSEQWYRHALAVAEGAHGPDHPVVADALLSLGNCEFAQRHYPSAEMTYRRAADIYRQQASDSWMTAQAIGSVAKCLQERGAWEDAVQLWREALLIRRKVFGDEHRSTITAESDLARALGEVGRHAEADSLFKKALQAAPEAFPTGDPSPSVMRGYFGEMLAKSREFDRSERELLEAHASLEAILGPRDPRTMKVAGFLSTLYAAWGRPKQVAIWQARSMVGS